MTPLGALQTSPFLRFFKRVGLTYKKRWILSYQDYSVNSKPFCSSPQAYFKHGLNFGTYLKTRLITIIILFNIYFLTLRHYTFPHSLHHFSSSSLSSLLFVVTILFPTFRHHSLHHFSASPYFRSSSLNTVPSRITLFLLWTSYSSYRLSSNLSLCTILRHHISSRRIIRIFVIVLPLVDNVANELSIYQFIYISFVLFYLSALFSPLSIVKWRLGSRDTRNLKNVSEMREILS